MTTITQFLQTVFGEISYFQPIYYYYIIGSVVLLIFIDGIFTFLIGALQGIFYKNGYR